MNEIKNRKFPLERDLYGIQNSKIINCRFEGVEDGESALKETKDIIIKTDKKRASYYNYYTNKTWGDAKSYDLCLNSAKLGIGGTAQAIMDYVNLINKIEKPRL